MKKLLFVVLAAIGMASCMNTDEVVEVNSDNAIAFADAFIENSVRGEMIDNGNLDQFKVWGWMKEGAVEAPVFNGRDVENNGAGWTYSPAQYWVPGFTYTFKALSSNGGDGWNAAETTEGNGHLGVVNFTNNDGTEDLIHATATVDAPALGATKTVELSFNHQLAKIGFAITTGQEFTTAGVTLDIHDIEMVVPASATIRYSDEVPTWALGNGTTTLKFGAGDVELLTIPAEDYGYAITFKVDYIQNGQTLKTFDKTSSVTLDVAMGNSYRFTAELTPENMGMSTVEFDTTVTPWNPGGEPGFAPDAPTATIRNNEIWYTNGSATEPTTPNKTDVFGANIVSNLYDANKECWVLKFDGEVTKIGYDAFRSCLSLTSINIPNSVTSIGDAAFYCCESLTSIVIPEGVTSIGNAAFFGCSSLESVTIGNGVTSIGDAAFYCCESLTSIVIPEGVTSIGNHAFFGCRSLTSITIPDSVTSIGMSPFYSCFNLAEFKGKFASSDGLCLIENGVLKSFANAGLVVTEYTIPISVLSIEEYTFSGSNLTSITIPEGVTSIGRFAFSGSTHLAEVYCKPTTPPSLDYDAFEYNAEGRKIYVPAESVDAYKSAQYWSDYANDIVAYDF
ncbi:MAG: leucine-rich repeat protein [Tidjanibacter sp.]|nr:leucine-rich repeat protein [Tidjanibacter sp.]